MHAATEQARFFVEGVRAPITADVAGRRRNGMVVQKELPFLRLDTAVQGADGRRARIARVAIAMRGDVPSLLLELTDAEVEPDDTLDGGPVAMAPVARTDSTVPFELDAAVPERREVIVGDAADLPALAEPLAPVPRAAPTMRALVRDVMSELGVLLRRPLAMLAAR